MCCRSLPHWSGTAELVEYVNIQSRAHAAAQQRHDIHGDGSAHQVKGTTRDQGDETQRIKLSESHVQRKHDGVGGNDNHHHHTAKEKVLKRERWLCSPLSGSLMTLFTRSYF